MNRTFLCVETTEIFTRELQRVAAAEGDRLLLISSAPAEGLDSVRLDVWGDPAELAAEIQRLCADRPAVAAVTDREVFTEVTGLLGAALGVARNPASAIAAARDKARMKQIWQAAGVSTAQGRFYRSRKELDPERFDYPVIVKPTLGFASCGVRRVDTPAELLEQVSKIGLLNATVVAKGASSPAGFLVEECLDGPEYSVDTVWFEGRPVGSCLLSRGRPELSSGPYYPDRLYLLDQSLPAERRQLILDLAHQAVRALGIGFGPTHTEIRFRGDTPYVLETAARPGGSGMSYRMLWAACGVDLLRAMYLSQVCENRDEFELRLGPLPEVGWDRDTSYFFYNLPYRGSGIISEIVGMDRLAGRPEVLECLRLKEPGNHLHADGDLNPDYFCHILARHVSTPDCPSVEAQLACYDGLVEIRF